MLLTIISILLTYTTYSYCFLYYRLTPKTEIHINKFFVNTLIQTANSQTASACLKVTAQGQAL